MKNMIFAGAMLATVLCASAEGYQVNSFSARQQGMGHVGVAMRLGAESQLFNPAAMVYTPGVLQVSGSLTAIFSEAEARCASGVYKSDNKASTPMNLAASFRIYDNLYGGMAFYTPYGSSINWGMNWPGAALNQEVNLKVFDFQPTLSWRIIPGLSVGAGLQIAWGSVDLTKGLVSASSMDAMLTLMNLSSGTDTYKMYGDVSPAYANLKGSSRPAFGFHVGAMWDVSKSLTIGASFRSKLTMKVKGGEVSVQYANEQARRILESQLHNLDYTNFNAEMPCPYVLTVGAAWRPTQRLLLALDAQLNGWKTYKYLDISFDMQEQFNQHLVKNYHNAMTWHVGAEYSMTPRLDLRAGLMVDTSPCDINHYNPETPAATKLEPTVGLTFRPVKGLDVNLSFMYVAGLRTKDATGQYADFLAPKYNASLDAFNAALAAMGLPVSGLRKLPADGEFKADYKVHAFSPAVGLSYTF